MTAGLPPRARLPLLLLGFAALASGIAGGLARLGLPVAAPAQAIAWHGALLCGAFFGTVISLERAVALGRRWAYLAPLACGAGGVVLLAGNLPWGFALLACGAALLLLASATIRRREPALHTGVLVLGAAALTAAQLALALGHPPEAVVPAWIAFFTLTIGGERLELSRLAPVPRPARQAFGALALAQLAAALASLAGFAAAPGLLGATCLALAAWLARYDIALRTVRLHGQARYTALCLLSGYAWLALGAALLLVRANDLPLPDLRDAALHAIFAGFVFSMVIGHAPIILPAVLGVRYPWHPLLYLPLALLHASVLARVAGDLAGHGPLRSAGSAGNALAIALLIACSLGLILAARRR